MDVKCPHSYVGFIPASPVQCQTLSREMALEVHAKVTLLRGPTTKAQLESSRSQTQACPPGLHGLAGYRAQGPPAVSVAGRRNSHNPGQAGSKCCALTEQKPLVVQG